MNFQNPNYEIEQNEDCLLIFLKNSKILNESNIIQIHEDIMDLIKDKEGIKVILDFEKVKYLSSSVLSKLVVIYKYIIAQKGQFFICSVDVVLMRIFKITKLDQLFQIFPDKQTAIESLK